MNGFMQAILFVLGIVLMILGLGAAQYGLALYGDRSNTATSQENTSPYRTNLLFAYIPEFTLFSAVCIFFLGLLLLLRATRENH